MKQSYTTPESLEWKLRAENSILSGSDIEATNDNYTVDEEDLGNIF